MIKIFCEPSNNLIEMTLSQAQKLVTKDIEQMTLEQLQSYRVQLLDALRYSTCEYGDKESYELGFLVPFVDAGGKGFVPKDKFLTTNLQYKLSEVEKALNAIYNEDKYDVLDYDDSVEDYIVVASFPTKRAANSYIRKNKSVSMIVKER